MNFIAKIYLPVRISTLDVAKICPNNSYDLHTGIAIRRGDGGNLINSLIASIQATKIQ